jgi:hypothetical protein
MTTQTPEYLVDQIQNVNVQGPLVTLTLARAIPGEDGKDHSLQERLQISMTAPNFMNTVNALNQIAKRMAEQNEAAKATDANEGEATATISND